ncbi:unnamed protein product [Boreogadus saida]
MGIPQRSEAPVLYGTQAPISLIGANFSVKGPRCQSDKWRNKKGHQIKGTKYTARPSAQRMNCLLIFNVNELLPIGPMSCQSSAAVLSCRGSSAPGVHPPELPLS